MKFKTTIIKIIFISIITLNIFISCKEESPSEPKIEEAKALIQAPESVQLLNGTVQVTLDGSVSKGEITEYLWQELYPSLGTKKDIGFEDKLVQTFSESGEHTYSLTIRDFNCAVSDTTHTLTIKPESFGGKIWFFRYVYREDGNERKLGLVDPNDYSNVKYFYDAEAPEIDNSTMSQDPNGKYFVFGQARAGSIDLAIFDIETMSSLDEVEIIYRSSSRAERGSWGPSGWIAFTERNNKVSVLNPQTGEVINIQTEPGNYATWTKGYGPSWLPDGNNLIAGYTPFNADEYYDTTIEGGESVEVYRISTITNIFSESPEQKSLHDENYLIDYYGKETAKAMWEGINGLSVSPDGSLVAYNTFFFDINDNRIVIARTDGTGIEKVFDYERAVWPSWSPDGQKIGFAQFTPGFEKLKICSVNKDGTGFVNISDSLPAPTGSYISYNDTMIKFGK